LRQKRVEPLSLQLEPAHRCASTQRLISETKVRVTNEPVSLLVRLNVVECKSLHGRADRSELLGLFESPVIVPLIHYSAFDHPHGGSTVSAGAMDERWLIGGSTNNL